MGVLKYPQLFALMKCLLSLSHGNSTPERGFSINKLILETHGTSIHETTLTAIRFVKDELLRVGGERQFSITKELIKDVQSSYTTYEADRLARAAAEAAKKKKEEEAAATLAKEAANKELEVVENSIAEAEANVNVADDLLIQAQSDLEKALNVNSNGNVERAKVSTATAKLKLGNERKRKLGQLCWAN